MKVACGAINSQLKKEDILLIKNKEKYINYLDLLTIIKIAKAAKRRIISPLYEHDGYLCMAYFDGENITEQRALFLNKKYLHFKTADELAIFEVAGAKCCMVVDVDIYHPEVARFAKLKGVDIIFSSCYIEEELDQNFIDFGAYSSIECNNIYGAFTNNYVSYVLCPLVKSKNNDAYLVPPTTSDFSFETDFLPNLDNKTLPLFESVNLEAWRKNIDYLSKTPVNELSNAFTQIERKAHGNRSKLYCALGRILPKKLTKKSINNYFYKKYIGTSDNVSALTQTKNPSATTKIVVAAAQVRIQNYKNAAQYLEHLESFFITAKGKNAKILVFPEYFSLLPLLTCPFLKVKPYKEPKSSEGKEKLLRREILRNNCFDLRLFPSSSKETDKIKSFLFGACEKNEDFILNAYKILCKKYNMIAACGSLITFEGDKMYNSVYLFDENGNILGKQNKINPMEVELNIGIDYSEDIKVFDTTYGKVAMPICMDASYFENYSIIKEKGANIALVGIANMEQFDFYSAFRGVQLRSSEYPIFSVKAALVGNTQLGIFTGKAGIYAPCTVPKTVRGAVAESADVSFNSVEVAEINLNDLNVPDKYRYGDNPQFFKKLFAMY